MIHRSFVRFAVGSATGLHSAVWRLWTQKSDIYIAARSLGGIQKVSLHEDGNCFLAFTEEHVSKGSPHVLPDQSRVEQKWTRPAQFAPGWTLVFQIIIPGSELAAPTNLPAIEGDIVWIPVPPDGSAVYLSVLVSERGYTGSPPTVKGHESRTRLVHQASLENGQTVWLLAHDQPMTPEQVRSYEELKQDIEKQFRGRRRRDGSTVDMSDALDPRAFAFGFASEGHRFFLDFAGSSVGFPPPTIPESSRPSLPPHPGQHHSRALES